MRYEKIQALRQALHQCPERSDQEHETIEKLKLFLQKNTTLELHPKDGWFYAPPPGGAGNPDCRDYVCTQ